MYKCFIKTKKKNKKKMMKQNKLLIKIEIELQ